MTAEDSLCSFMEAAATAAAAAAGRQVIPIVGLKSAQLLISNLEKSIASHRTVCLQLQTPHRPAITTGAVGPSAAR